MRIVILPDLHGDIKSMYNHCFAHAGILKIKVDKPFQVAYNGT